MHVQSWDENYRGILTDDVIASRDLASRQALWTKILPQLQRVTLVASNEQGIVRGFASAVVLRPPVDGFDSYLQTLYLTSDAKGHGVGAALLRSVAQELRERGCKNMALRTLRLNPAREFYERFGARLLAGFSYEAGVYDDVAYGFDDLAVLCPK